MGLLDKLIKEGSKFVEEVATEENKEKAAEFLNNLKEGLSEIASEENKEKAAEFLTNLKDGLGDIAEEVKKNVGDIDLGELKGSFSSPAKDFDESFYEEDENDNRTCEEKLVKVLKEEFPDYSFEENVSPVKFGGEGKFMDYSYVVYKDGAPKLAMMLIGKTTCSHREYRWSKEFAQNKGIPFINFIRHMPNKEEYIKQRLHKYL